METTRKNGTINSRGPFKIKSSRDVYSNPWLRVHEDEVIRPDGSDGVFGIVEMKAGSSVVAIDDDSNIVLGREFKYGISRVSVETFSGAIEAGESPLDAAKRELSEETGFTAGKWIELGVIDPFTTIVNSQNHMFLALDLARGQTAPDAGEIVDALKVSFRDAVLMVMDGRITHGASCVAILKAEKYLRDHGHIGS